MKLTPCPACRASVSDHAKSCPHCGQPLQSRQPARWVLIILLAILFGFFAFRCGLDLSQLQE